MGAPLVTGTITEDAQGRLFNSLLLWKAGEGAVAQYDKIHPVPFAEYLPDRNFWYPFAPSLFDLVPRDYAIGTRPNVFDINGVLAGVAICFDIVDDGLIHQMIDGGAQVILAPTNNADFGHTDESVQQLAIARLRAMETSRCRREHLHRRHQRDHRAGRQHDRLASDVDARIDGRGCAAERRDDTGHDVRPRAGVGAHRVVLRRAGRRRYRRPAPADGRHPWLTFWSSCRPTTRSATSPACSADCVRRCRPRMCWWSTTPAPTAPAPWRTPWPRTTPACRCGIGASRRGSGRAYVDSFRKGLAAGYLFLVEMDADGSHDPAELPAMLAAAASGADLVLGSRWVPGGAVRNWPWLRQAISRVGNSYARVVLGSAVHDLTSGFRVFRAEALRSLDLDTVSSQGYCFQVELAWRLERQGAQIVEHPITFVERTVGRSKMHAGIVAEALLRVTVWGLTKQRRLGATPQIQDLT